MIVVDIAKCIDPKAEHDMIGIIPSEKLHEQMIGFEDADFTYEYDSYNKVIPYIFDWAKELKRIKNEKKVASNWIYSRDKNFDWVTVQQLQVWVDGNISMTGKR